jgi:hypothetical protein
MIAGMSRGISVRRPLEALVCAVLACTALPLHGAGAQGGGHPPVPRAVPVRGVVFDSVRGTPLRNASVSILGGNQHTTTDEHGRFTFDSVPAGLRTFAVQHSALDSLGFSGLSRRADVSAGENEVTVAVPSFATLWRRACAGAVPRDSGLVYGTIRDVDMDQPVKNASVEMVWKELRLDQARRHLIDRQWTGSTNTDSSGGYALCGVATDVVVHVRAVGRDSAASGWIDLVPAGMRVQRRDLYVARAGDRTGSVVGFLTDVTGEPFADARVTLEDSIETRSDFDGHFEFHHVAAGSRQITIRYVGVNPVTTMVNAMPADTVMLAFQVPRVTTLATVNVSSTERARILREEYENRKIMYQRYMMDSTVVGPKLSMLNVFNGLPNVSVKRFSNGDFNVQVPDGHGMQCTPELRVDGVPVNEFSQLLSLSTNRVVSVEVYAHAFDVPSEYMRTGIQYPCGLVAVWTKWAFRLP